MRGGNGVRKGPKEGLLKELHGEGGEEAAKERGMGGNEEERKETEGNSKKVKDMKEGENRDM